jgi:hypothetical protein
MRYSFMAIILIVTANFSFANDFKKNCIICHKNNNQLSMFMSKYTLLYSSEKRIKNALFEYLRNPTKEKSIMPRGFINRWGIKEPSPLDDLDLMKSIDTYYELYNIKQLIQ